MRAMAMDTSGRSSPWTDPVDFGIDNLGPRIEVLAPTGEGFLSGPSTTVRVRVTDEHFDIDQARVEINIDGGDWFRFTFGDDAFTFVWDLADVPEGEYEMMVRTNDQMGNAGMVAITVRVDNDAPSLSIDDPLPGQILSGRVTLIIRAGDRYLEGVSVRIDDGEWKDVTKGAFTFETGDHDDGDHTIHVRAVDGAGQETHREVEVAFDNSPPTVIIHNPKDGSQHRAGTEVAFGSEGTHDTVSPDDLTFIWTSSIDGNLGTKPNFTTMDLSEGDHTIRLTVSDPAGHSTHAEVEISIVPGSPVTPSKGISIILVLVIILVCVIGLVMHLLRSREREE